ncbi:MAG: MFS transporter [Thiolinea sp.]
MITVGSPAYWRVTLALSLGAFMVFANIYLPQPLLPTFAAQFGISALQAGWILTLTTLTLGLSLLFYGALSDALGRKPLMVMTLAAVTLITLLLSFADSYASLLWLRALQGLFLAGLPAIAIAYLGEELQPQAMVAAVGVYIAANTLGGIGGRLIGGYLGEWLGWEQAFLWMGLISLVLLVLFILLLPRSVHFEPAPVRPALMLRDLRGHLRNPVLLAVYFIGGINFLVFVNQYSYIVFVLADEPYSLSARFLGLLFLTYLSGTFASMLSGRLARYWSQPSCMMLGILLFMTGSLLTLQGSLPAIISGFLINSFGFFLAHAMASSWVSRNAQRARATASALYLVFYYLGASSGGFYLEPFWLWRGWEGVVAGSLLALLLTLSLSGWLFRVGRQHTAQA